MHLRDAYTYCDSFVLWASQVFQRRLDGSVDFYHGWTDYKNGFGLKNGEFWLGNDNIHTLTAKEKHVLRIDLKAFNGETRFAEYSGFSVDAESHNYVLRLKEYLMSSTVSKYQEL